MANAVVVQLRTMIPDSTMKGMAGKLCQESDVGVLLNGDVDVYQPNGEPLIFLRRGWIPKPTISKAYEALHHLRTYTTDNRGIYAGADRPNVRLADGTLSKNTSTRDANGNVIQARSAIVGYFDRQGGRFPYCRTTRFTANEVERWKTIQPMIKSANRLLKESLPARYNAQKRACEATDPHWVIKGTVFSTMTVNNNTTAAIHQDKGDFKDGFGVISCVRRGQYSGGVLCFPQFRCGVDLQDGDTILFNPHAWHGMTPIKLENAEAERISCVYYFREKMRKCGTPEEETKRATKVRGKL